MSARFTLTAALMLGQALALLSSRHDANLRDVSTAGRARPGVVTRLPSRPAILSPGAQHVRTSSRRSSPGLPSLAQVARARAFASHTSAPPTSASQTSASQTSASQTSAPSAPPAPSLPAPAVTITPVAQATVAAHAARESASRGDGFEHVAALWSHDDTPLAHEVTLFRHRFAVFVDTPAAELLIWADTRYDAWLDGVSLGRGPARFSATWRSYDVLSLPDMSAGEHVLSVRVQWAPNQRRSASGRPVLAARVQRRPAPNRPRERHVLAQTGPGWQVERSTAWRSDAVPLHALGLIGPSEVLDFRSLPVDWISPAFDDEAWQPATIISPALTAAETRFTRRYVAPLVAAPITPRVIETGRLSPDAVLVQFEAATERGADDADDSPKAGTAIAKASVDTDFLIGSDTVIAGNGADDGEAQDALGAINTVDGDGNGDRPRDSEVEAIDTSSAAVAAAPTAAAAETAATAPTAAPDATLATNAIATTIAPSSTDAAGTVDLDIAATTARSRQHPGNTVAGVFTTTLVVGSPQTATLRTLLAPAGGLSLGDSGSVPPEEWHAPATTVDGIPVAWSSAAPSARSASPANLPPLGEAAHPLMPAKDATRDHVTATVPLAAGTHVLRIETLPADGLPLSIAPASLAPEVAPGGAVRHPGRRLLLANPVHDRAEDNSPPLLETAGLPDRGVRVFAMEDGLAVDVLHAPAYVVLDLGRTRLGRLDGSVEGPAGATMDIGWDERLTGPGRWPLPHPGRLHAAWSQVDTVVMDGRYRPLNGLDERAGRYVVLAFWNEGVRVRGLRVLEARAPLRLRGWIRSGDPELDQMWSVGAETVRANTTDVHADPWRERGMWWGDAWATNRAAAIAFGSDDARRRGLRLMAEPLAAGRLVGFAPRGDGSRLPDYALLWLLDLHEHVQLSADVALLKELWPAVVSVIDQLELRRVDGLLDLPPGPWPETSFLDWAAGRTRFGASAPLNALYEAGLRAAADLAAVHGASDAAEQWTSDAERVKRRLRETLWQPAAGRFASTISENHPVAPSAHAQAWPLATGLVPPSEQAAVGDALFELLDPGMPAPGGRDLPAVELYGFHWVLEAWGRAGQVDRGLAALRRWHGPLLERGLATWPESWTADTRWDASLSHGWSAAPTVFLTRWLLGARRSGPRTWRVRPGWSGPQVMEGALPLPEGSLAVRWVRVGCNVGIVEIDAPFGTHGALELEAAQDQRLWLDGRPILRSKNGKLGTELPSALATGNKARSEFAASSSSSSSGGGGGSGESNDDGESDRTTARLHAQSGIDHSRLAILPPLAPPEADLDVDPGAMIIVPLNGGRHRIVAQPLGPERCSP